MNNDQIHEWSRHYDSLLWNVTTLFAAAIGGLLIYTYSNFHAGIAIFGMVLTWAPLYFAASFRESRDRINQELSPGEMEILFEGRKLKQWMPFTLVFIIIEVLWVVLLLEQRPNQSWVWYGVGLIAVVGVHALWQLGKARQKHA